MEEVKRGPGRPPKVDNAPDESAAARRAKYYQDQYNPLGQKLTLPPREGFSRRWTNDWPGRVMEFFNKGWEFIKDDQGKNITKTVGTAEGGGGLQSFAMEAPLEWAMEDHQKAVAESNARLESIKRPATNIDGVSSQDRDKFYNGPQGSSIRRDR